MWSPGTPMQRLMKSGLPSSGSGALKTIICCRLGLRHSGTCQEVKGTPASYPRRLTIKWSPISTVSSIEPLGITRACTIVPSIRRNATITQNQETTSRQMRSLVVASAALRFSAASTSAASAFTMVHCLQVFLVGASPALDRAPLKPVEQPSPPNFARVNYRVQVRSEPVADPSGVPYITLRVDGHIDYHRRADNVGAGDESPVSAVVGVVAIVAHGEKIAGRHYDLASCHALCQIRRPARQNTAAKQIAIARRIVLHSRIQRQRIVLRVRFLQRSPIDEDLPVHDLDVVARQTDHPLDQVRRVRHRRVEHDDLLAVRLAPQRHLQPGERDSRIVTRAADDQVVAYQNSILHRAAGNHSRLHHRGFQQKERHHHPKPRQHLAPQAILARRELPVRVRRNFPDLSFHDEPPLPVAPAPWDSCRCSRRCRISLRYRPPRRAATEAKDIPANRRPGICGFARRNCARRSVPRAAAYPRRNSMAKSWAGS